MKIRVSHFSEGRHALDFEEKPAEFLLGDDPRFAEKISVHTEIEKRPGTIYLHHEVRTEIVCECDRCLEQFQQGITGECRAIYTTSKELADADDDIRYITPDLPDIDISEDIRETALLGIPYKLLCRPECRGLCPQCGANRNLAPCDCAAESVDPRWEKLASAFKKN